MGIKIPNAPGGQLAHADMTTDTKFPASHSAVGKWWTFPQHAIDWFSKGATNANKNYIINGDFQVLQRGSSFTAAGATADMWRSVYPDTVSFSGGVMTAIGISGSSRQEVRIEGSALNGKEVTLSFLARRSTAGTITILYKNSSGAAVATPMNGSVNSTTFVRVSKTFTVPTDGDGSSHNIALYGGIATLEISEVKLELGSVATPFVPDAPAVALAKCQWYFVALGEGTAVNDMIATGLYFTSTVAYIPIPIHMRTKPTSVTQVGTWRLVTPTVANAITITMVGIISSSEVVILTATTAARVAGDAAILAKDNDTAAKLYISSEL